jgi:hypothetical protein
LQQLKKMYLCKNKKCYVFFSDYCKDMIFGADRWIDPKTETKGHYILRGTNIPIFFSDDITVKDESSRNSLLEKIKSTI